MPAPLFCYNNLLRQATIVSEATISNFGFAKALDGGTSTQAGFAPGASRDVIVDFTSAKSFDHVCVAGHNLNGVTLTLAGSADNVSYTDIDALTYDNNHVQVSEIDAGSARYLRLRFSGMGGNAYVSDIFVGEALELPYGIPHGFVPPEQGDQDAIDTNMTGNGAIVGITVSRKPKSTRVSLQDYHASWFEAHWYDLIETMKLYPVYFLWGDGKRAFYCTLQRKPPQPSYNSNIRQSATLDLEGFVE